MNIIPYEKAKLRNEVVAWPRLANLLDGANAHIAGGYAAWHMSDKFQDHWGNQSPNPLVTEYHKALRVSVPSNYPKDLDVFTYNVLGYNTLAKRLRAVGFEMFKESEFCSTWKDTSGFLAEDNWSHLRYSFASRTVDARKKLPKSDIKFSLEDGFLPIQLIKPVFGKDIYEVLEHFDFYAMKFAILDGQTVLAHQDAVKCLDERALKRAHSDYYIGHPFYSLLRALKYVKKGYKINYMELYKLVVNAQAADMTNQDTALMYEMLCNFSSYINFGEFKGMEKDFTEVFRDAYGEWYKYISSKNAKL